MYVSELIQKIGKEDALFWANDENGGPFFEAAHEKVKEATGFENPKVVPDEDEPVEDWEITDYGA